MPDLDDGQRVSVRGSTSTYTLERIGDVRSCTCPAWRNQAAAPAQRSCKHLRAHIGESIEAARVGAATVARMPPPPPIGEDREIRERRRAILADVLELFPVVHDRMLDVYGLRMPRHLAYAIGWWLALSTDERADAWGYIGTGPCGVADWFEPRGLERPLLDGLDARLHDRYRRDPPEMVSVFGGNSDGGHWGLWYDDPAELPRTIVHNWARDTAETHPREPTLLATFAHDLASHARADEGDRSDEPHRAAVTSWLGEVLVQERQAFRDEQISPFPTRDGIVGGLGPWAPGRALPPDLGADHARYDAYQAHAPAVAESIARARAELATDPMRALVLGRELHWFDDDAWRADGSGLLIAAYRALGRDALAEIAQVHHAHRDLASVGVYGPAPSPPLTQACERGDLDAVHAMLRATVIPSDAIECLATTTDPRTLDALLARPEVHAGAERAQLAHIAQILGWPDNPDASYADRRAPHRAALVTLIDRCGIGGTALAELWRVRDPDLAAHAIARADLAWRSERQRTVLHVACRAGNATAVAALLDRGADPRARDRDDETPYDAVRHFWEAHRAEAAELYGILRARGAAPEPVAPAAAPGTWTAGTKVTHAKFGAGTLTSAAGTGDDAKLTIEFADRARTLLARYVQRA